ncbi:MAG: hypothetical protein STHCBS139747_003475 [Sporothrix thermara]
MVGVSSWRAVPATMPTVYYPKRSKNELYQRLSKQLEDLNIAFTDDFAAALGSTDHVVDAIFGKSSTLLARPGLIFARQM